MDSENEAVDAAHEPTDGEGGSDAGYAGVDPEPRLRVVDVERIEEAGSRIRIRVSVELEGVRRQDDAEGLNTPIMELRLAAEATLAAASAALEDPDWLELVGVKLLHAFDADVILIAVRTADEPGRKLVGAVPATVGQRTRAAVSATLDAINRVMGPKLRRRAAGAD
ncbi:MAG: hypothetical protein Q8W51_12630 [Candidatus Palauibacterales bacterium]|nr:hypothetical protein [Candidatus Palauibacterales bacterium]MDP2530565.1 hypothetical protein [Candidatus Palauibacterales bacterium]MDP2582876.1 hypothetical protein [Candidatus Palauibacterales bacterium]